MRSASLRYLSRPSCLHRAVTALVTGGKDVDVKEHGCAEDDKASVGGDVGQRLAHLRDDRFVRGFVRQAGAARTE